MAETLLAFGVEKLWDLLVRESDRFQGVEEQFDELKSDMNMLRCFLEDADAKKHSSAMVRNSLKEIKEIVCDAEDIIETFLLKEEHGKKSGIRKRVERLAWVIVDRRGLCSDIRAISKRISKVIRDMQSLGVQQVIAIDGYTQSLQERQREMRKTFSNDNETVLVGLEGNVQKLVGYLVEEDINTQVVSITGMGGIGKTTLARQVFNHEMVKKHFDGLVWVCVSQQFRRQYVWHTILQKLCPEYIITEKPTEEQLQEKLFQVLETQKTLIVLDDIWREEDWDRLKPIFPPEKGWKVLLTSRNEGVALRADPACYIFKPNSLTLEESWIIFQKIAFPRYNTIEYKVDEEMEEMGKEMIKHCGGLPLAVKVLGGLLATQYTLREWKRIYENIRSHIVGGTSFNDRNISSVYHVLYLSFEELPVYLKHCFLYLAHFPEDFLINVENLSYYWAGEGIPRPRSYDGATIREVGDAYMEELVKRNMVISERDVGTSRFETCHLHDMMREVCLLKAEEEDFVHIIDARTVTSTAHSHQSRKSRRLVVQCGGSSGYYRSPKLKSLLFITGVPFRLCFTRLQLMRVLDLSGGSFGHKLSFYIGKLIHLRFLSLQGARMSKLPSTIRNLKLLLYLNLNIWYSQSPPVYVPNVLKELRELRYLSLPAGGMHDKTNLELCDLVNLETLENFSTNHSNVSDLHCMTRLRTLSIIFNADECTMVTLFSSLGELRHLENLTISDTRDRYKEHKLMIHIPRLPDVQHFPSQLTTITLSLSYCCYEEDPMSILEKLLHLNAVSLCHTVFLGRRMVCSSGGFPQLRSLILKGIRQLEEWIVEEGSMPILHTVSISDCKELMELPDGMRFITSLKELNIVKVEGEFLEKLEKDGEDYYKVQHIPLLNLSLT
ncbi:unnamed protein product [Microthlaspi erraticum]|uniref:NB-ARC domain-containing protein n=1 Tax=Microthlaspi erraticum TaxID=1685480 RepID=A0A6D2K001_9BRAS|nr:unnamed protein product [Microthlaspi erraticum]